MRSRCRLRVRLQQHRANPICASCHATMDPIGFALESLDAVGAVRTFDSGERVDPSGELATARSWTVLRACDRC